MPTPGCPFARAERNVYHPANNVMTATSNVPISKGRRSHEYLTARGAVVRARKSQMIPQIVSTACGRLSGECERGTQECVRHVRLVRCAAFGGDSNVLVPR